MVITKPKETNHVEADLTGYESCVLITALYAEMRTAERDETRNLGIAKTARAIGEDESSYIDIAEANHLYADAIRRIYRKFFGDDMEERIDA